MLKMKAKIDTKFLNALGNIRKDTAVMAAKVVEEEFHNLLFDAPQYSGNYVANMAISPGSRVGRSGGGLVFPMPKNNTQAFRRGNLRAVDYAINQNANFVERATRSIRRGAGWMSTVVVYNKLNYAAVVEAYDKLRPENAGGEHAMARFEQRLKDRFSHTIKYDPVTT